MPSRQEIQESSMDSFEQTHLISVKLAASLGQRLRLPHESCTAKKKWNPLALFQLPLEFCWSQKILGSLIKAVDLHI